VGPNTVVKRLDELEKQHRELAGQFEIHKLARP